MERGKLTLTTHKELGGHRYTCYGRYVDKDYAKKKAKETKTKNIAVRTVKGKNFKCETKYGVYIRRNK